MAACYMIATHSEPAKVVIKQGAESALRRKKNWNEHAGAAKK